MFSPKEHSKILPARAKVMVSREGQEHLRRMEDQIAPYHKQSHSLPTARPATTAALPSAVSSSTSPVGRLQTSSSSISPQPIRAKTQGGAMHEVNIRTGMSYPGTGVGIPRGLFFSEDCPTIEVHARKKATLIDRISSPEISYDSMFSLDSAEEIPHKHWRDSLRPVDDPLKDKKAYIEMTMASLTGERYERPATSNKDDRMLPQLFHQVKPDGSHTFCDRAKMDLVTLADWLDESRSADQTQAYSLLLIAKDLIRRLMSDSVEIWNSNEDVLKEELARSTQEATELREKLESDRHYFADYQQQMQKQIVELSAQEIDLKRQVLHTQIRLDKVIRDLEVKSHEHAEMQRAKLELTEEVESLKQAIDDSIWSEERLMELLDIVSELPYYTRFRMLQALLSLQEEQGMVNELCQSLEPDLGYLKSENIHDAFVMNKLEQSQNPMELLQDLAQQRVMSLAQQGKKFDPTTLQVLGIDTAGMEDVRKEGSSPSRRRGSQGSVGSGRVNASARKSTHEEPITFQDAEVQTDPMIEMRRQSPGRQTPGRASPLGRRRLNPEVSSIDGEWSERRVRTPGDGSINDSRASGYTDGQGRSSGHDSYGEEEELEEDGLDDALGPIYSASNSELPMGKSGSRGPGQKGTRRASKAGDIRRRSTASKKQAPPQVLAKIIPSIYEDKLLSDLVEMRAGRKPIPFAEFTREYFSRRYGLPSLAQRNHVELIEGLHRHREFNKRIMHFARNLGIGGSKGPAADTSQAASSSDAAAAFYCSVLARVIPQEVVNERMCKPDCLIEMDVAMAAVNHCMPSNSIIAASPHLKANILSSAQVGKNTLPAIDVDDFLDHVMTEYLSLSERNAVATVQNEPEDSFKRKESTSSLSKRSASNSSVGSENSPRRSFSRQPSSEIPKAKGGVRVKRRSSKAQIADEASSTQDNLSDASNPGGDPAQALPTVSTKKSGRARRMSVF